MDVSSIVVSDDQAGLNRAWNDERNWGNTWRDALRCLRVYRISACAPVIGLWLNLWEIPRMWRAWRPQPPTDCA